MTSHVAPPDTDQRGGSGTPYTITESRLQTIRKIFMYPYYDQGGNSENTGDYQKEVQTSNPQVIIKTREFNQITTKSGF